MELMQASRQWATRPADERYVSLLDMADHFATQRNNSRELVVSTRQIEMRPVAGGGIEMVGPHGTGYEPTNFAFGQLATLAEAPAGYLRTVPAEIASDCVNYGLKFKRNISDVGLLLHKNGSSMVRAATGPRYGRIWNADVTNALIAKFGDGVSGDWKVPGEFGKAITVNKDNTTLYASDRDMFVFLADEERKIEIPNRRDGKPGLMSRGFFVWNSEVGDKTFGIATFAFDYTCCNRIVWGATMFKQVTIRHTASAPDRFIEEVSPALVAYANSSAMNIVDGIKKAQLARIDNVDEFLATRFGKRLVAPLKMVHSVEEHRPIETIWDATTAVTAYAKGITWQDDRVELERKGGELLKLAA